MTDAEEGFEGFYRAHAMRHRSAANRWLVAVVDPVLFTALVLSLRKPKLGIPLYFASFGVLVAAHAALERNLGDEVGAFVARPFASLRAEGRFLAGMWRKGPSTFDPAID